MEATTDAVAADMGEEGLEEGQAEQEETALEAAELDAAEAVSKEEAAATVLEAAAAKAPTPGLQEAFSEAGASLTSGRLKFHEKAQAAIQGLKEGHLSEAAFWNEISSKDRAALWKKKKI